MMRHLQRDGEAPNKIPEHSDFIEVKTIAGLCKKVINPNIDPKQHRNVRRCIKVVFYISLRI